MTPLSPLWPLCLTHVISLRATHHLSGGVRVSFVSNFLSLFILQSSERIEGHFHFDRFVFVSKLSNPSFLKFAQHKDNTCDVRQNLYCLGVDDHHHSCHSFDYQIGGAC